MARAAGDCAARIAANRTVAMRIASFAVLVCLALAACDLEPTFDASSLPAYQNSLGAIKARLSEQDQQRLQLALLTLAAGSAAEYTAFALSDRDTPEHIEALDGVANSLTLLDRMRPTIDGHTAAAVIRHVADDLDLAIARAERQAGGAEKALAAFIIENPRYSWTRGTNPIQRTVKFAVRGRDNDPVSGIVVTATQPTLEFSIYNGSKEPISGIVVTAMLIASNRDAPLLAGDVGYRFASPLQPGVQQRVEVAFRAPGPWTAKQIDTADDMTLRVKLSNVFKADGGRLLAANVGWIDVMRKKRDFLRGS
jgi:hypothetical protein